MKKVISLVLTMLMIFSVFTVLPTASAAETYVAGTEVKVIVSLPETDAFTAVEGTVAYGSNLEYVADSLAFPHIVDPVQNTNEVGSIYFNSSSLDPVCDISDDHVLLTANFKVLEDVSAIDVVTAIDDIFIVEGTVMNDVSSVTETTVEVISVPTQPTEPSSSEEETEPTVPEETEPEATEPEETEPEVDPSKVSVFGDINIDLVEEDTNVYTGVIDLDAGVYTFKMREFGVEMGGNYAYTDEMRSVTYNAAWGAVTTFTVSGGRYTFTFNTSTNRLTVKCKPYADLVEIYGDINIELVRKGTGSLFTGSARVDAGSYNFKINDMGTHMGFGYEFDDVVYQVEYKAEWSGETTFKASGGLYTFKYDVDTNKLTVQLAPSGAGDVRIFGDIDLNLIKDYGTLYSATTTLQAGTYQFRVDELGTTLCQGSTFDQTIYKVEYKSEWKSATTFNVEDGKYTFRFDTATNQLTVLYAPLEDKISIFGDIELELTKGSNGITYTGQIELEAGTYAFRIDKRGLIYCYGGTFTDTINKVYSTEFASATTFNVTGGTYKFQFNSETNKLLVTKSA